MTLNHIKLVFSNARFQVRFQICELAYHVEVLPRCRLITYFVQLTACFLMRKLAVIILLQARSVVKYIVHYLLD